jgi:hypothetical protein
MSDTAAKKKIRLRRNLVRAALILVYLGLMVLVFVQGKGHTILIDNKDSGSFTALEGVRVAVDRQADSEYAAGDRDMAKVVGQVHRVVIDRQDGSAKIEKTIRLPLGADTVLLSLPKLVAGAEPYLEPFQVKVAAPADEEAPAAEGATLEGAAPAAPSTETSSTPNAGASSASSDDSGGAVFYSEPGGQGTATTDSSSKDATSSDDSGEAVFYSEPGGQGTESH